MITGVFIAAAAVCVFAIAAIVIGREARRLDAVAPRAVYDVDQAVEFVSDMLPEVTQARLTPDELRGAYDWLCRKIYSPTQIARRGLRSLGRYPISKAGRKAFGSFSTDYGYRRTYAYRNAV